MKVYIVIEDNGEWYEAYEEWIVKVFSDEQNAKKFVSNSKIKAKKEKRTKGPYYREHNFHIEEKKVEDIIE